MIPDSVFGGFEGVEVVDEDRMGCFHSVADYRSCIVWDGKVVWSWIGRTDKRSSPRCRVDCGELEESDEVVVLDTGDGEFVVLELEAVEELV